MSWWWIKIHALNQSSIIELHCGSSPCFICIDTIGWSYHWFLSINDHPLFTSPIQYMCWSHPSHDLSNTNQYYNIISGHLRILLTPGKTHWWFTLIILTSHQCNDETIVGDCLPTTFDNKQIITHIVVRKYNLYHLHACISRFNTSLLSNP